MGLYRTALRLATIEALRPTALLGAPVGAAWPTLAQWRVFDSRIDPIADITPAMHKAAIVVYTEATMGYGGQKRGGPPFRQEVDLVFEISQIASAPSDADPTVYIAGVPYTDRELEAELDLIEWQIYYRLMFAQGADVPTVKVGSIRKSIWRALTGEMITDPRSAPHRTSEENARLAMRTMTWKIQVDDDHFPTCIGPPPANPDPLDTLPNPLRWVGKELIEVSETYKPLLEGLAAGMVVSPPLPQLAGINVNAEIIPPGQAQTGTENVSAQIGFPLWSYQNG
jgi:hypothetical protein